MKVENVQEWVKVTKKIYSFEEREMQSLVNAIFEMCIRMYSGEFKDCTRDDAMAWVAHQLAHFKLKTIPMGSSWGVLKD